MKHWMFCCREVSQKVSASMDCILPFHQRMMIRFHLLICKYCTRLHNQLFFMRDALRMEENSDENLKSSASFSSGARERIKQVMRNQLKKRWD